MKMNVILTLINPITNETLVKKYFDVSVEELNKVWNEYLQGSKGASTSNLGYEPENYPKYSTGAGFTPSGGYLYTWTYWESK